MSAHVLTCPTCHQDVRGIPEPVNTGALMSCTCGVVVVKLPAGQTNPARWRKIGAKGGRALWLTVIASHRGDGHTLTVIHRGSAE